MNRDRTSTRPWYFWPLSALLVGILIGLIIGWGIWPVKWTNAYPQDLRAAERNEYLAMVAESYAANPNVELAQARLATWSAADLPRRWLACRKWLRTPMPNARKMFSY